MKYLTILCLFVLVFAVGCLQEEAQSDQEEMNRSEEEVYFEDYIEQRRKWGYMDQRGREIIPPQYDAARNFKNGLAAVNYQGKWGIIDSLAKWVIQPEYQGIWEFNEGLARVKVFEQGQGFVNRKGRLVIPPVYEEIYNFSNSRARFQKGGYYGFINQKGHEVIQATLESATDYVGGYTTAKKDGYYGLIDTLGSWFIPNKYQHIQYDASMEGVLAKKDNRYIHLTLGGDRISIQTYHRATPFYQDRAWIRKSDQWELIDRLDQSYASVQANHIVYAGDSRWIIQQDSGFVLMNSSGIQLTDRHYAQINKFFHNRAVFYDDPRWGYLDLTGKEFISPRYFLIWDFKEGLARVADESGIYFIDTLGSVKITHAHSDVRDFFENRARFQEQ